LKTIFAGLGLMLLPCASAWGWGQEGHSIIAEIGQRRLTPAAVAEVARLLGDNHSLASVASWADDERDIRPETANWHFVDIPINSNSFDPATECAPSDAGDCVIAELERLKSDLRCAANDDLKKDALRFAVHLIGDIHQPLHTVFDQKGGNGISVEVKMRSASGWHHPRSSPTLLRNTSMIRMSSSSGLRIARRTAGRSRSHPLASCSYPGRRGAMNGT
jgi:hypothetical protein